MPTEKTARSTFDLSTQEKRKKTTTTTEEPGAVPVKKKRSFFFSYSKNIRKKKVSVAYPCSFSIELAGISVKIIVYIQMGET